MSGTGTTIESAYLGDERSRVSVLSSLRKKLSSDGSLSVLVDSSLLPMFEVGGRIELTDEEVRIAKEKAVEACGGSSDNTCIEQKTTDFQRARLEEKELESQSRANIVKGRRLTVTVNENGRKRTYEVPEGQTFEWGKPKKEQPLKIEKSLLPNITIGGVAATVIQYVSIFVGSVLYVFSVLATFKTFNTEGYVWTKYIATALSVVFPFSGFLIVIGFFAVRTWIQNMPTPK